MQAKRSWSREDKLVLMTSLITFSCVALGILLYIFFGHQIIESIYKGESVELLNKLLRQHRMTRAEDKTLDYYLRLSRVIVSRVIFLCIISHVMVIASVKYRSTICIIKEFFTAVAHPINLAVFRMVLFWMLFNSVDISQVVWWSQVPAALRIAPRGLGWLLDYLPINETWATISAQLFLVFSFTAMIGLFTRTSALLTVILGFYVLGLPQFFGKVNHYHHMLWFPAILAASPCGYVFSCDALTAAWKRADRGITDPPGPSQAYALPLRFVWLLMGIIYFFPGFWKSWQTGMDWAFSDNLKFIMYSKWMEFDDWTPSLRIDQFPTLYKSAALSTIIFEISFIFLIFFPRVRFLAPLGGLIFHILCRIFLRIFFGSLVISYITFFDWNAIFCRIGCWLYREDMYILYDGSCKLCRRTIAALRVFDIFGRLIYVNALDREAISTHGLQGLASTALMTDMYAIMQKKSWAGFSAYRVLAARIPVLWPILPFLYLWPVPMFGTRIYQHVADSRTCTPVYISSLKAGKDDYSPQVSCRAVATVGALLLCANTAAGIGKVMSAWPFALYPVFDGRREPAIHSLEISGRSSTGEIRPLKEGIWGRKFGTERLRGLGGRILATKNDEQRQRYLQGLGQLWAQSSMSPQDIDSIRFYKVTLVTIPERRQENPIHRELLFELKSAGFDLIGYKLSPLDTGW
jgi:predicted DCC family thiol-disulfide oxidoreductase YuxK